MSLNIFRDRRGAGAAGAAGELEFGAGDFLHGIERGDVELQAGIDELGIEGEERAALEFQFGNRTGRRRDEDVGSGRRDDSGAERGGRELKIAELRALGRDVASRHEQFVQRRAGHRLRRAGDGGVVENEALCFRRLRAYHRDSRDGNRGAEKLPGLASRWSSRGGKHGGSGGEGEGVG